MKFSRLAAAGLLLVANVCLGAPVTGQLTLPEGVYAGLDDILKKAVEQSPRMLSRSLDLEIAEQNRITARAGMLPSLSSSFSYFEASDDRADLPERQRVTKIAYNVTLSQPIFHWGERRNTARIGEIQQKITQGQVREAYRLLAQELRAGYLRLIVLKLGAKRAVFNRDFTAKNLRQEEDRAAKGVISEVEIAAARLSAEQAQNASDRAEFEFHTAKISFARLAGLPAISDDSVPDTVPGLPYALEPYQQLLAGFLNQKELPSPEAVALRNHIEVEKLNYANQRTRLRPKVNAVVATNQDEQSYTANVGLKYEVNSIYGGVSVYWTIFDGFASSASARASLARRRQMEIDYRQLSERLGQDAQNQLKLIEFSARNMSIYDRYLNKSETNLASMQEQFRRGARSETEVAMAQIGLYDSQANAMGARIDFFLKIGDFLGVIVEDPILANLPAQ
jgi:outer membrane protein TolC